MVLKFENIPRHSFFSLWCIKVMKPSTYYVEVQHPI